MIASNHLTEVLRTIRQDHPEADDEQLVTHLIVEVKKPGNESYIVDCIGYACWGVVEDCRAAEDHHQAREAQRDSEPAPDDPNEGLRRLGENYEVSIGILEKGLAAVIEAAINAGGCVVNVEPQ
jgi:hypothetical protein